MFQAIGDWFSNLFGGGKKKKEEQPVAAPRPQQPTIQATPDQIDRMPKVLNRQGQQEWLRKDNANRAATARSIGTPAPIDPRFHRQQQEQELFGKTPAQRILESHAQQKTQDTHADEQFRQNLTARVMANRGNRTNQQIHESVDRAVQANRQARAAQRTADASKRAADFVGVITAPGRAVASTAKGAAKSAASFVPNTVNSTAEFAGNTIKTFDENNQFADGLIRKAQANRQETERQLSFLNKADYDIGVAHVFGEGAGNLAIDTALTIASGGTSKAAQAANLAGKSGAAGIVKRMLLNPANAAAARHYVENVNDVTRDAKSHGLSHRDAFLRGNASAGAQAALERVALNKLVNPNAKSAVGRFMKSAITEGSEEAAQQLADNAVRMTYDPKKKLTDNVLEAAIMGGALGGPTGAVMGSRSAISTQDSVLPVSAQTAAEVQHNIDNGIITPDTKHLSPEQRAATAINARARVEEQQAQQVQEQSQPTTEAQVADKLRISDERAAEIQAYNNHIGQLRQQESKLLAQGLSENSAPIINNRKAQAEAIYARDHIGEVDENGLRYRMRDGQQDAATQQAIIERSRQVLGDDSVLFETLGTRNGHDIDGFYREADDIIRIAKGRADMDTMNHEMVHRVMANINRQLHERAIQYIIQRDGAENLVREYRARGYDVALTDEGIRLAAEEKLADGFMQYAKLRANGISVEILGQKLTLPRHIITYFERVWERIKSFAGKADRAKQLYAQMETGKFRGQAGVSRRLEDSFVYKLNPKMALDAVRKFKQLLNAPRNVYAVFGKVSDKTKGIVEQLSGESLQADAQIIIESSYARHLNKHTRDVVSPLTDADIANISEVVNNPDSYAAGEFKRGKQRVVLEKQMDNAHVAVVEVIKEGNALNVVTFYNRSFRVNDTANGSSRGDIRNVTDSPNEPIIANPPRIVNGKRLKLDETLQGFAHSSNRTPVATIGDAEVVLGDYGRNAMQRKADKIDRFDAAELPETLRHITGVYRSGDSSFRKDNIALVATMPDGEKRAVYTRLNVDGQEEIINWHKITIPGYEDGLQSYGTPAWNRTRNFGLEHLAGNPPHRSVEEEGLAASESSLHDSDSVAKTGENVNIDTPKVGEAPHLTEHAQDARDFYFEEYKDKGADAMRRDLIESIWSENKKGQGVDFIQTPGEYYGGKRVSNNNPFYAGFYEEYGRKPTKQEITAIVDDALGVENELGRVSLPRAAEDYLIGNYFGDIDGLRAAYSQVGTQANTQVARPTANKLDNAARQEASEALQQEYETHLDHQWAARLDEKHKQEILKQRKAFDRQQQIKELVKHAYEQGPSRKLVDIADAVKSVTKAKKGEVEAIMQQVADDMNLDITGERAFVKNTSKVPSLVDPTTGEVTPIDQLISDEAVRKQMKPGVEHAVPADTERADLQGNARQMIYRNEDGTYGAYYEYRKADGTWHKPGAVPVTSALQTNLMSKITDDATINKEVKRAYEDGINIQYIWRESSDGANSELVKKFEEIVDKALTVVGKGKKKSPPGEVLSFDPNIHYIHKGKVVDGRTGQVMGNYVEITAKGDVIMYAGKKKIHLRQNDLDFDAFKKLWSSGATWTTEGQIDRMTGALDWPWSRNKDRSNSIEYFMEGKKNANKETLTEIMVELPRRMQAAMLQEGEALGSMVDEHAKKLRRTLPLRGRKQALQEAVYVIEPARPKRGEKAPTFEQRLESFRQVYGDRAAKQLAEYNAFLRATYKNLLMRVNEKRLELGMEPIHERADYLTHTSEIHSAGQTIFDNISSLAAGDIMDKGRGGLPAKLVGLTGSFKPNMKFNQFAQARYGDTKPADPFTPLKEYAKVALHNIHMTDAITMNRSLETAFRAASEARSEVAQMGPIGVETLANKVDDFAQNIRGNEIDIDEATMVLKKIYGLERGLRTKIHGFTEFKRAVNKARRANEGKETAVLADEDLAVLKSATERMVSSLVETSEDIVKFQELTKTADSLGKATYFVREHANRLAGKTDAMERAAKDEAGVLDRAGNMAIRGMQKQAALSKIVGNFSSVVAQAFSLPDLAATTSPTALGKALKSMWDPKVQQASAAVASRYANDTLSRRSTFDKTMGIAGKPMEVFERTIIQYSFAAKYEHGISKGLSHDDAVRYAERFIGDTVTYRDAVSTPRAYKRKLPSLLLQFQREVVQQGRYKLRYITPKRAAVSLALYAVMTQAYEAMTGSKPGGDVVGALVATALDFAGAGDEEREEEEKTAGARIGRGIGRMTGEVVAMAPLVGSPINTFIDKETRKNIFGTENNLGRYAGGLAAVSQIQSAGNAISYWHKADKAAAEGDDDKAAALRERSILAGMKEIPAGSQLRKSAQGYFAMSRGHTLNSDGEIKAEVDKNNPLKWVQAAAFGENALSEQQRANKTDNWFLRGGDSSVSSGATPQGGSGIDVLDAKDRLSLKKSIKKGSTIIDNGVLKTKSGEVKRDIHRQMAEKQGQSDEAYTNYLIGYGLDEKSDQQQQASTGDPTLDSLLNTARMGERSKRKAAITKAVAMFSDKKKFASLPDWVKDRFYKEHGFSKFDVAYSAYAGLDAESKIDGLYRPLAQQGDRKALLDRLWKDRRAGLDGRKMMADDKVISALQQEGFITKAEARTLREAKHIKDTDGRYQTKVKSSTRANGGGRMSRAVATGTTARFMGNSQRSQYASAPRMALSALPLLNASGVSRRGRSIHATIASVKQSTKKRRLA